MTKKFRHTPRPSPRVSNNDVGGGLTVGLMTGSENRVAAQRASSPHQWDAGLLAEEHDDGPAAPPATRPAIMEWDRSTCSIVAPGWMDGPAMPPIRKCSEGCGRLVWFPELGTCAKCRPLVVAQRAGGERRPGWHRRSRPMPIPKRVLHPMPWDAFA